MEPDKSSHKSVFNVHGTTNQLELIEIEMNIE